MKHSRILGIATLGLAATSLGAQQQPNIVLIYADDIGFGDFSCYGGKLNTPNVDKLAASGIRFTDAHTSSATSTPSRFSMLTGEYAWRHKGTGILKGNAALIIPTSCFTLGDMFIKGGYNTAVIGKWHLGLGDKSGEQNWNETVSPNPSDIGFQYSFLIPATGDRTPCIFMENGKGVNLEANDPVLVSYTKNFPGEPGYKTHPELIRMKSSHGHNAGLVNGVGRIGYMKGGTKARWIDENIADVLAERADNYITQQKDADKPFFLYFATHDIHVPRLPHQRFAGKSGMGPRGDALLSFDWTVGQVMAAIEKNGLTQNTIIMISSDNGPVLDDGYQDQAVELLGEHKPAGPLRGCKCSAYEGGTRVPTILSWPGTVAPAVSDKLLAQQDLFASFASMIGVEIPKGSAPDSENLIKAWLNQGGEGRTELIESGSSTLAFRQGPWKYIPASKGKSSEKSGQIKNTIQLYNLSDDIGEQKNLAKENPQKVQEMIKAMNKIVGKSK